MGTEIERKFLVVDDTWRVAAVSATQLVQGYLGRVEQCSVRVRTGGGKAFLNIKGRTVGVQRAEYEYAIPVADAQEMLETLCGTRVVAKTRHIVPFGGRDWEVDVFEGHNAGLVVAEVELDSADASFETPTWAGEEVSHDTRYYNAALAESPYSSWE